MDVYSVEERKEFDGFWEFVLGSGLVERGNCEEREFEFLKFEGCMKCYSTVMFGWLVGFKLGFMKETYAYRQRVNWVVGHW